MNLLANKVAIITGAGRGIGRAIALKYAQEGASVVITDLKIDETVEAFVKELEGLGVKAKAYASNAANFEDAHKLVEEVVADFGRIDVLVNNAGITRDGLMMRMTEEQWDLVVGVSGNAGQANYSASKAGMIGLAKSIAKELGARGVRANAIAPGFIITDMTGALSEEVRKQWEVQIPLRRGGTPEDVANVATFLASDLSSYVSGQTIHVCGGMNM